MINNRKLSAARAMRMPTLAEATPASPLRADVVSFEANEFSENSVTKKNPARRYFDLLNNNIE